MQNPPARKNPSVLAQALEPIAASIWVLFMVWTAITAVVWFFCLGEVQIKESVTDRGLRDALNLLSGMLDPAWITLAALNAYMGVVAASGLQTARKWAGAIFVAAMAIAWASVSCGYPLGPVKYTARLAAKVGPVPLALPLLWVAIVFGARAVAERLVPRANHAWTSVLSGVLALVSTINAENVAWKMRSWWQWYPGNLHPGAYPPFTNYLTWLVAGTGLAWFIRPTMANSATSKTAAVFITVQVLFILAHISWWTH